MPILYDQYQLANSAQIPKYLGSTIPEMQQVANVFQDRYDYGVQQSDILDQSIKSSSASSFDQPVLQKLKDEYRGKLKEYAAKGDYENMWRNVMLDAREFVNKYKPIAENQQRISQYQEQLNKDVAAGKLTPEQVRAKMAMVSDTYNGLQYNDKTGQYDNQFSGSAMASNVDLPKKINTWLEGSHAVERGWKVKQINGDYYQTNGSTSKKLPWSSIKPIIDAAVKMDPEVQAYLQQEAELAPYTVRGYSSKLPDEQVLKVVENSPTYLAKVQELMAQGKSGAQALAEVIGGNRYSSLLQGIDQYSAKGIIDERTSESATEYNPVGSARATKEIEDQTLALTAQIWQPDRSLAFTPDKLDGNITQLKTAAGNSQQELATWASQVGLKKVGTQFLDKDGNDVTFQYQQKQDIAAQAARTAKGLEEFKAKAQKESGFVLDEAVKQKAEKARTAAYQSKTAIRLAEMYTGADYKQKLQEMTDKAYEDALIAENPTYAKYKAKLEEYSKTTQLVGVQTFAKTSQNKAAEDMFKNFALNLDANGLASGALGMQWGTGEKAGIPLSAEEYKKVRDEAKFAGVGIDADGQYKFYYKVGDVKSKDGGEELVVKIPAFAGTSEMLIKNGQTTLAHQIITQSVSSLPGTGKIELGGGNSVKVEKNPDGSYELAFPLENGKDMKVPAASRAEAVNFIIQAQSNALKRN